MLALFVLCVNEKPLLYAKYYEDLEDFVEELKELNKTIDRRNFKIMSGNEIIRKWKRS